MQIETLNRRKKGSSFFKARRSKRMEKVYITAGLFIIIGLTQLAFIRLITFDLGDHTPLPGFMWLVIALICLILMVWSELFNKFPVNWTLGSVAVESTTMCVISYDWTYVNRMHAAIIVLSVILACFILNMLGAFLPIAYLPGYRFMLVTTIIYIIAYLLLTIVVHAVRSVNFLMILDSATLLYTVALTLYGSTIIHHRRAEHVFSDEYVLSATTIAAFFFIMIHLLTSVFTCEHGSRVL